MSTVAERAGSRPADVADTDSDTRTPDRADEERFVAAMGEDEDATGDGTYTVQHGDTLSDIAEREGVSLQDLIAANPELSNPDLIHAGQQIRVPGSSTSSAIDQAEPLTNDTAALADAPTSSPSRMGLSQDGLDLIKGFEGKSLTAYQDSGGVWTIGYGHTGNDVQPGQRISDEQAEQLLQSDVQWAEDAVRENVNVPLTQNQFDALVSFTYNLGEGGLKDSRVLEKLNAGDYAGAQEAFGLYVHDSQGSRLDGLVRRRAEEADLFGNSGPSDDGALVPGATNASQQTTADSGPTGTRDYTVKSGDTLWDIAQRNGISLQSLIEANPQIQNPDLIYPGDVVHIPGGATSGTGAIETAATENNVDAGTPIDGQNPAAIARQFLGQNAEDLKRSGQLPMNPDVPSNVCCANFVSACLQKAGLLPDNLHTDSVNTLENTLRSRGWQAVDPSQVKPGDVVIIRHGGGQHTVLVESNDNGHLTLIGSNNRNDDGSQRITEGELWGNATIYTPPGN